MRCKVCRHPKYPEIHDRMAGGEALLALSRRFGLGRMILSRHANADPPHPPPPEPKDKDEPKKTKREEKDEREPLPSSEEIAGAKTRPERREILAMFIDRGRWRSLDSARKFRRLWPDMSLERIADLASEAADDVRTFRGPRRLRREVAIAQGWEVFRKALGYGQLGVALNALRFVAELDGLVYEPGLIDALLETQAWKIIEPLLQREAPRLWEKFVSLIKTAELAHRKAEEIVRNPAPLLVEAVSVEEPPSEEQPDQGESFAAPRNGGRRPRAEAKDDEGSDEG